MQRPSRQNSKDQGLEVGLSAPLRRQLAVQQVSRRSRAQPIPAALVNSLQGALTCACPEHIIGALCLLGVWFGRGVVSVPGPQLVPWELVTLAMSWILDMPPSLLAGPVTGRGSKGPCIGGRVPRFQLF